MASHWSTWVSGITEKQAYALDRMAADAEDVSARDGMDLLTEVSGCSRSKIGKMDRLSLRRWIDECFKRWGRK